MEDTLEKQIEVLEDFIDELILERYELWKTIQSFNVSANKALRVNNGMKVKSKAINTAQNKLNKLKRENGWSKDQIDAEDKRRHMSPRKKVV